MIVTMVEDLVKITEGFHRTSTIENVKPYSVTFAKNIEWFQKLFNCKEDIFTLTPMELSSFDVPQKVAVKIRPIAVPNVVEAFVLFHNKVNKGQVPKCNKWGEDVKCHPSAVVGVPGMRYIMIDNNPVFMKHMGNVVVKNGVEIGPYTVIHRATIDSTIIGRNVKIGALVNIGHNAVIGKNTFIMPQVNIGGSTEIGENCWLGMGCTIRDNVKITNGVKIGMGSLVVKNISTSGVYFGSPAKRRGEWDGNW